MLDGKMWEWDLNFRWEWDGNGDEVIEMGGNWYKKVFPPISASGHVTIDNAAVLNC